MLLLLTAAGDHQRLPIAVLLPSPSVFAFGFLSVLSGVWSRTGVLCLARIENPTTIMLVAVAAYLPVLSRARFDQ